MMTIIKWAILALMFSCTHYSHSPTLSYFDGETELEGKLYLPKSNQKAPAVLVIHAWMGLDEKAEQTAQMLAERGYVALAVDMYGKGVRARDTQEAGRLATIYRSDRDLMRGRIQAALDYLKNHPRVDGKQIAALGFCFGGGVALELARSGADITHAISFHGNLDTPNLKDAQNIKGTVLVLHGDIDPYVPETQVQQFKKEMNDAKVDYVFVGFGGAVHSFTDKEAGTDISTGAAYDPIAAQRAWEVALRYLPKL